MRVAVIQTQTERKPQDRSVRRAETRSRQARMHRVHGPIRPTSGDCAIADADRGEKHLFDGQIEAILTSEGSPLGECRFRGRFFDWNSAQYGSSYPLITYPIRQLALGPIHR